MTDRPFPVRPTVRPAASRPQLRARATLAALLLATGASAQIGILTLPSGIGDDPRSVRVIGSNHVVVSNQVDGWQHFVNVSIPSAPSLTSSLDPPYGDQWFEAEYTPTWGGRLFTGHRFQGVNMIDVSNPSLPVVLDSQPAGYHFRGLRYQRNGANGRLFYNATNQGLQVWDVLGNGTTLSAGWNNFATNQDGNGLELIGNELFQLGAPPFSPGTRELRTFAVVPLSNPAQCFLQTQLGQQGDGHALLRRSLLPAPRIVACKWLAGLDLVDVTNPCNPVVTQLFPSVIGPVSITYWGAASLPSTPVFVVYGSIVLNNNPLTRTWFWWFWTVPAVGPASPGLLVTLPLDTHDIEADPNTGRIYVVGRNTNTNTGELWIF
ncbi:MAG: hypothetical protein IPM29_03735 [Planctomycetes bacterium]|nr:hypothetical protein [Planctomycetota bacterium]